MVFNARDLNYIKEMHFGTTLVVWQLLLVCELNCANVIRIKSGIYTMFPDGNLRPTPSYPIYMVDMVDTHITGGNSG